LPFEKLDKLRQPRASLRQLESHRVTQGQIVIEGLAEGAHTSPPGHGKASAPKARWIDFGIDPGRLDIVVP
jgi:hypothetical protein